MPTNILHDKLSEIAGRIRTLSLAAGGLASITAEDDCATLADLADEIERELRALAEQCHTAQRC
jgi:hypothetical protein